MVDKSTEWRYLELLRAAWIDFPLGEAKDHESPDFLIRSGTGVHGVEFTEFMLSPELGQSAHQVTQSIRRQILDRACEMYRAAGGIPAIIDIDFDDRRRLTKRDIDITARGLALAVSNHDFPEQTQPVGGLRISASLPKGIISVTGCRYRGHEVWDDLDSGWVRRCDASNVQSVIAKKSQLYDAYRQSCDSVTLVVVFSAFLGAPSRVGSDVLEHPYDSAFDSTIALFVDRPNPLAILHKNDV